MERWTLLNAVKRFNPNQEKSLKKNKGNLNVRGLTSLIKEMECHYEEVKVEGRGKNRIIVTEGMRENKRKKKDMREFNKGQSPSHTKNLALMLMSQIDGVDNIPRTINNWADYFGIISSAEKDILSGVYNAEVIKPYLSHIVDLGIIEEYEGRILQDLSFILKKIVKEQLKTVLYQAVKMKLIKLVSSWKGKTRTLTQIQTIDLEEEVVKKIKAAEAKMLSDHNISKQYSIMYRYAEKTKAFKSDWIKYLKGVTDTEGNVLNLQYIFEVFQIKVLDDNAFVKYLEAHYPEEGNYFNFLFNSIQYETNLRSYVESYASKNHEKIASKSRINKFNEENKDALMRMLNITEDDFHEDNNSIVKTGYQDPYEDLVRSKRYITCMVSIHNILHKMDDQQANKLKEQEQWAKLKRNKDLEELLEPSSDDENPEEIITTEDNNINNLSSNIIVDSQSKSKIFDNIDAYEFSTLREDEDEALTDIRRKMIEYEYRYGDKAMEKLRSDQEMEIILSETKIGSIFNEERVKDNETIYWEQQPLNLNHYKKKEKSNDVLAEFKRIRSNS